LRHIRVASKYELKQRIIAGINDVNRYPVIDTDLTSSPRQHDMIRTSKTLA
jgi:hypothetical protein